MNHNVSVDLGAAWREAEHSFAAARSLAVASYADLEQGLCSVFGDLTRLEMRVAGLIFFSIVNTRARMRILERLQTLKLPAEFHPFLSSVIRAVKGIDGKRNEIIHWHQAVNVTASECVIKDGVLTPTGTLTPPNHWDHDENTPNISHDELLAFAHKADFYARSLNTLSAVLNCQPDLPEAWRGIVRQSLDYPPPADHPLYRPPPKRASPPPPSWG